MRRSREQDGKRALGCSRKGKGKRQGGAPFVAAPMEEEGWKIKRLGLEVDNGDKGWRDR